MDIPVSAGNYTLELTDDYGYHVSKRVEVKALQPVTAGFIFYSGRRDIIPGVEVFFDDISSNASHVEWDFGDGSVLLDDLSPAHLYDYTGDFDVTLRAWNADCEDEHAVTVTVIPASGSAKSTGVSGASSSDRLFIFPKEEIIYVEFHFEKSTKADFFLYDVTGKLIYSDKMTTDGIQKVKAPALSNAIYFVKVVTPEKTFSGKVLLGAE